MIVASLSSNGRKSATVTREHVMNGCYALVFGLCLTMAAWSHIAIAQGPPRPPPPAGAPPPVPQPNANTSSLPAGAPALKALPKGYARTSINGKAIYVANGNIYQRVGNSYEAVTLAPGTRIDMLPKGSQRDRSFSEVVYENNGVRFKRNERGYFEVLSPN